MREKAAAAVKLQRKSWSLKEDEELTELVQKYDIGKWTFISKKGNFDRTTESCRKRWENHLNPTIEKGELSADDKKQIALLHAQMGNQWSYIAKQLKGRTPDQIKVYWNSSSRQRDAHPPAPLEGTSSAGIIPQATSMLPSNQQTGESNHSIKGLIEGMEEEQLPPSQSLEEAFTPQAAGGITSHQRQLIHIEQHPQGQSLSMFPSNQQTGETSHSIEGFIQGRSRSTCYRSSIRILKVWEKPRLPKAAKWTEYELPEQFLPLQSLEEELTPQAGGSITSHQRQLIHIEQHPQGQSLSMFPSNQQMYHPTSTV